MKINSLSSATHLQLCNSSTSLPPSLQLNSISHYHYYYYCYNSSAQGVTASGAQELSSMLAPNQDYSPGGCMQ